MGRDRPFENARKLIKRYRITRGETFRLRDVDPSDTGELTSEDKPRAQAAPRSGISNRSYYEEVLVVRVHPELLAREKLPARLLEGDLWKQRYEDIRHFERFMGRNGTCIVKFFLHVSRGEQRRRFLERLDDPAKQW